MAVNSYEWLKKKNGKVEELDLDEKKIIRAYQQVTEQMTRLNRCVSFYDLSRVSILFAGYSRHAAKMLHKYHATASTDVTGFGILGKPATWYFQRILLTAVYDLDLYAPIFQRMKK